VACREEHPLLVEFARMKMLPIYGLNYKDERADGMKWLANFGNPYEASLYDRDGRVGIDFGVYGVPESFLIDAKGVIRYKQIGPFTREAIQTKLIPLVQQLQKEAKT
jgi:cytochrome c biogenesis protein CcmG/thiol:disulfide interchange protein DsbE